MTDAPAREYINAAFRLARNRAFGLFMPSIFEGQSLVPSVHPFACTFQEQLLLDAPRAARARKSIDRWVADLGNPARHEIQQRLLAPKNAESSRYAFYELLAGQAIKTLICTAIREPSGLPVTGRPDFGAWVGGRKVVFEVRTLEEEMPAAEREGRAVLHELAGIRARWVVTVDWDARENLQGVRLSELRRAVKTNLHESTENHGFELTVGRARLVGHAYTVDSEMSIIQTRIAGGWAPGVEHIRSAVEDKARAYRPLKDAGIPLVVIVCTDNPLIDAESLCTALFGDEMARVHWTAGQPPQVQTGIVNFSGCLTPDTRGSVRNTIVSCVFLLRSHLSQHGWSVEIAAAHNPWAANPFTWTDQRVAMIDYSKDGDAVEFTIPALQPTFEVG